MSPAKRQKSSFVSASSLWFLGQRATSPHHSNAKEERNQPATPQTRGEILSSELASRFQKDGPKLNTFCWSPKYWMCHWTERNKVVLGACIKVEIESESRVVLFAFVIIEIGSESFTKIRSVHKDEKLSFQYCLSLVRARLWLSAKLRGKRKPGYGSLLPTLENANGHSDPIFETNPVTKSSLYSDCVVSIIFGLYCHGWKGKPCYASLLSTLELVEVSPHLQIDAWMPL